MSRRYSIARVPLADTVTSVFPTGESDCTTTSAAQAPKIPCAEAAMFTACASLVTDTFWDFHAPVGSPDSGSSTAVIPHAQDVKATAPSGSAVVGAAATSTNVRVGAGEGQPEPGDAVSAPSSNSIDPNTNDRFASSG